MNRTSPFSRWIVRGSLLPLLIAAPEAVSGAGSALANPGGSHDRPDPPSMPLRDLGAMLEPIRAKHGLPALGGAIVTSEGLEAIGAVGVRKAGGTDAVTPDDRWHLGSCTKAMTATMIARLVEAKKLSWETTIGEAFPDSKGSMRPEYAEVTLEQLLTHRGGLPVDRTPDETFLKLLALEGPIRDRRAEAVRLTLSIPPSAEPGDEMLYSNRGYVVAGAMAERATGKSWEDSMSELLFAPLGMESAGFGAPGTVDVVDQPRGHSVLLGNDLAIEPGPLADNPAVLGPCGTVHVSLADWAEFVALHLRGAGEGSDLLGRESFEKLHAPYFGPGERYAMGWLVTTRPWAKGEAPGDSGRVLVHNGSNSLWFAVAWIAPEKDLAVLAVTNFGGEEAAVAVDEAASAMIRNRSNPE